MENRELDLPVFYRARYMKINGEHWPVAPAAIMTRRCMFCGKNAAKYKAFTWHHEYCAGGGEMICGACGGQYNMYVYEERINGELWLKAKMTKRIDGC